MNSKALFKGTGLVFISQIADYSLSFIRNLMLARLLAKDDYGLASVFMITVSMLEMVNRMAFGKQVVQSRHGDQMSFIGTAHVFQFVIGLISAFLIVILSYPIALLFDAKYAWWGFALLCAVPLFRGCMHLDISRFQRELNYVPSTIVMLVPHVLITVAAWPMTKWLNNYSVVVWLIIFRNLLMLVLSHIYAKIPYIWHWDKTYAKSIFKFSWPLLFNGFLIIGLQQSDQMIVASVFSLSDLATYALAFSLVSIPWMIFAQVSSQIMLPILSSNQDDATEFTSCTKLCFNLSALLSVVVFLPIILTGEHLMVFVYGNKYSDGGLIVAMLGIAFMIRFLRFTPTIAAMAKADTLMQLSANLWKGSSLIFLFISLAIFKNLVAVAACAIAGEFVALIFVFFRMRHKQGITLSLAVAGSLFVAGFIVSLFALFLSGFYNWAIKSQIIVLLAYMVFAFAVAAFIFSDLKQIALQGLSKIKSNIAK